ncbi:MAG: hypothetical protein UZ09_BCD002002453 [Bacteroidetes bacterium OLB9]|nr:MAG: hypothetical protein UZ09_BCD002002453 [Bacteroidetes bacterium OLB9]
MHYMRFSFLTICALVFIFAGCTKEEAPNVLTYPTTFTFNTPLLQQRAVYKIENLGTDASPNWKFTQLTEDLGKFDRSDAEISDTLNAFIRNEFSAYMVSKITLLSSTEMEIEEGKLILDAEDPLKDTIQVTGTKKITYAQSGNLLMPGMYLNNDSREIFVCNEFIYASAKVSEDFTSYDYYRSSCNGPDPVNSLTNLIRNYQPTKFDTASVEYVNYIYSSFK